MTATMNAINKYFNMQLQELHQNLTSAVITRSDDDNNPETGVFP
jgi:hypothetical protein